jgi:uncharacterized repeat protein (TIGR01451 family)
MRTFSSEWVKAMRKDFRKLVLTGLTALVPWAAHSAAAQTVTNLPTQTINLPLSSVGSDVGWDKRAGAVDDYRLAVFGLAANKPMWLEIYSPDTNLEDYANKRNVQNYYGDEIYSANTRMNTGFRLLEQGSINALVKRDYGTSNVHRYDLYGLPVQTTGNGKNAFSFRVSPGVAVEASQFTVVTRGQFGRDQLAARFTIGEAAVGKVLRLENFDADGPREMQIFVRLPDGSRRQLTSSGDVQWAGNDIRITPQMRGEWALLIRILPTTKQFSNSVKFRLKLDGKPYFSRVPFSPNPTRPQSKPPVVDLSLAKTISADRVNVGQRVTYSVTVANVGSNAATGVVVTDRLPEGLTQPTAAGAQINQGTITWNITRLLVGERRTFKVEATAAAAGRLVNAAEVKGNEQETNLENNKANVPLDVVQSQVDLSVTKTAAPASIGIGQNTTFTLTVRNNGPAGATGVVLNDALPSGVDFVSSNPQATPANGVLTWNIGELSSGQSRVVTVQVRSRVAGQFINRTSVRGNEPDPRPDNNQAQAALEVEAPVGQADLGVTKTVNPDDAKPGDSVTYTLVVVNNGPADATGVTLSDTLPQGLSNIRAEGAQVSGNKITWNIGNLANGQRRTYTVQATATVLGVLINSAEVSGKETDSNLNNNRSSANLTVAQAEEPGRTRESEVTLATRVAATPASGVVILSDRIPANASYILGSSRLLRAAPTGELESAVVTNPTRENSDPIADPIVSGDRLFWAVPAPARTGYVLGYRLSHTGALEFPENRVGVLLQTPQSRSAGALRTPNGQPILGSLGDIRVLLGAGDLLKALQSATAVASTPRADTSAVSSGSSADSLRVYPSRPLTTDRSDQPELTILARDASGNPSTATYATVSVQPEPSIKDAEPTVPGFQVRLVNGEGRLPLSNLGTLQVGTPDRVEVLVQSDQARVSESFPVAAAQTRPLIVSGALGVQANINSSGFSIDSTLRAFGRSSVGGNGLFTAAVNTGGEFSSGSFFFRDTNLLPPANPYERFPLLGDASQIGTDANSSDSVFVRLEADKSYLQYGQLGTDFRGLLTNYNAGYNGLKGVVRQGNFSVNSFAAMVPNANRNEAIVGDGTSFYRLGLLVTERPVVSSSEQVARVVRDRSNPNLILSRTLLLRGNDYEVDYTIGTIKLRQPLQPTDLNGNPQTLEVRYAVTTPGGIAREMRGGVQAGLETAGFGIKATLLSLDSAVSGLAGLGIRLGGPALQLEAEATSPINRFGLAAGAARLGINLGNFGLEARYQDVPPTFQDTRGAIAAARDITVGTNLRLGAIGLTGNYSLNQSYTANTTTQQLSGEARVGSESFALLLGGGASFGLAPQQINNFETDTKFVSVGAEVKAGRFGIRLRQLVGLGSTPGATDLGIDYAITQNFGIRIQNRLSYISTGSYLTGSLGVRGNFANNDLVRTLLGNTSETPDPEARDLGTTNISATYEMSNLSGDAGRTRVGLDTSIPLGSQLQVGLNSNVTVADKAQGGASGGIGLRYNSDSLQANLAAEVSAQASAPGIKQVYGFGFVWRASNDLILSPQATYVREANGTDGSRFGLAGALRADRINILTNNIFRSGFYRDADNITLEGEVRTSFQANERFFLRFGGAYRSADVFTGQVGAGLTYFLTDALGLGLNGSYLFQPATSSGQMSLGLEGSLRLTPGLTFSVGTNLIGTQSSLLGFQTQPGLYLRLDWLFDESLFGK